MSRGVKTRHPVRNAIVLLFFRRHGVAGGARGIPAGPQLDFLQSQGNARHSRLVKTIRIAA
jgi:hypothetical protein